ncbi:hypothetical protein BXY85_3748 [Roseivirga pacifica]|uniref:Uncharacterized protein n=1 Tax=Roseivirga pacifica TaxID=1267423 RepID=A0A1I0Q9H0_9BACT|nr:hypothetical protein [Roseivirga pacifica]RKQ43129.1 hypothetical protein BXY85_3748 [Roseivirga pacifica]SEW23517.1 hypothetical protein SAMN05216290_2127 [Roseivirga pacifica]
MIDLRTNKVTAIGSLQGSDKRDARKILKDAKKDAIDQCKKLKGKSKRQCKRNTRKNFRKSKNNLFRGGESWLGSVAKKVATVASVAVPQAKVVANLIPSSQAKTTAIKNETMVKGLTLKDGALKNTVEDVIGVAESIFGLGKKDTPTTPTNQKQTDMKDMVIEFVSKPIVKIVGLGLLGLMVVGFVYKKFFKKQAKFTVKK